MRSFSFGFASDSVFCYIFNSQIVLQNLCQHFYFLRVICSKHRKIGSEVKIFAWMCLSLIYILQFSVGYCTICCLFVILLCIFCCLLCSNYCFCFFVLYVLLYILCVLCLYIVLYVVSTHIHSCFSSFCVQVHWPLPTGKNPNAVDKYHIISHITQAE